MLSPTTWVVCPQLHCPPGESSRRWGGTVHIFPSSVPGGGPDPFPATSRAVRALLKLWGEDFLFLPITVSF